MNAGDREPPTTGAPVTPALRWPVTCHRVEYLADVVFTPRWEAAWGQPLTGEAHVRVVFLEHHQPVPIADLKDPRIAVCIPGDADDARRARLAHDLRTIAEARAQYQARAGPQDTPLLRALEEQEVQIAAQRLRQEAAAYRRGQVLTASDAHLDPRPLFAQPDRRQWVQDIAPVLLRHAYPQPPWDPHPFPRTLGHADVSPLYDALVGRDTSPEAAEAAAAFAPGLGLASPEDPQTLVGEHCPIFQVIREEVEQRGRAVPWPNLATSLAHTYGLPHPLALLYTLCYVAAGQGALLTLAPGHPLPTRAGFPFPGQRLTRLTLPDLAWHHELGSFLRLVRSEEVPGWAEAIPLLAGLARGLGDPQPPTNEPGLADLLRRLAQSLDLIHPSLYALADALGRELPDALVAAVERLGAVAVAADAAHLYRLCAAAYRASSQIETDASLVVRAEALARHAHDIQHIHAYLQGAALGPTHHDLYLDRTALLAELDMEGLLASPGAWGSLRARFLAFRNRYTQAYARYHAHYQAEAHALARRIEALRPQAHALATFNSIPELGPPLGSHLALTLESLSHRLRLCTRSEEDLPLSEEPVCPDCGLSLVEEAPRRELETLEHDLAAALREKNRRLASQAVRHILRQDTSLTDRFTRLVQVADPSALANVLDSEVILFLREFLRQP